MSTSGTHIKYTLGSGSAVQWSGGQFPINTNGRTNKTSKNISEENSNKSDFLRFNNQNTYSIRKEMLYKMVILPELQD